MSLADSMVRASVAASLSCRSAGGQLSYAHSDDVDEALIDFPAAELVEE
jgi:hypothetical protein